jgi:hypothetical protein
VRAAARLRGHGWPDGRELSGGAVSGSPAADPSRGGWRSSGRGCSGRAGCCSPRQRRCERYQRPAAAARCRDPGACRSSTPPCLTCSRHRGTPNPPACRSWQAARGRLRRAGADPAVQARRQPDQPVEVGERAAGGAAEGTTRDHPASSQPPRGITTDTGPRSGAFTIPQARTSQGFCVARHRRRGTPRWNAPATGTDIQSTDIRNKVILEMLVAPERSARVTPR